MRGHEFECDDPREGYWGSGLLWPAVKIAAAVLAVAAVIHWVTGSLGLRDSPSDTMAVTGIPEDAPAYGPEDGGREIVLRANRSGQFILDADVNGSNVRFLVDTGAGPLVLSPADARRIGLDTHTLTYSERYQTANGTATGAPVTLRQFRVGSFMLYDVPATVMARPIPVSLLGMSVLSRFAGHEVEGGKLVLRW